MAIKKQQKRSIEVALPSQNGGGSKAPKVKKIKLEKPLQESVQKIAKKQPVEIQKLAVKKEKLGFKKPVAQESLEKAIKKPSQTNGVGSVGKKMIKSEKVVGAHPKKMQTPLSPEAVAAIRMKKVEKLKKKNEKRKEARKEGGGQYKVDRITLSPEALQLRIKDIESRPSLTKTAKRKLQIMKKKLAIADGSFVPKPKLEIAEGDKVPKSAKRHLRKKIGDAKKAAAAAASIGDSKVAVKVETGVKNKKATIVKIETIKPAKNSQVAVKKVPIVQVKQDKKLILKKEESDDSDDDEEEDDDDSDEEADDSNASFMNTTEEIDDDDTEVDDEEEDDDDDEEDEEEDDDDDEEDEEEEEIKVPVKKVKKEVENPQPVKKEKKFEPEENGDAGKKKRFVLFVGNLPYDASPEDIKKHFLTKVSAVSSVRVPTKPGCNTPRGFAYVEVENDKDYEKGLSLHNTTLNGRRLNVEYTRGGSKSVGNRQDVVSKNKKLHAMRKQGMLAGSQKDGHKRNDRRQKQKQGPA